MADFRTYRVVIVEDDKAQAKVLAAAIKRCSGGARVSVSHVLGRAEFERYVAECGAESIDVLFMDVRFGEEGPDGIELVRRHVPENAGTQVVYVTGYVEYCTRVYRTPHVYFLTKPVNQDDLEDALGKALANLDALDACRPLVVRDVSGAIHRLPYSKIHYIESMRRKVFVHTANVSVETYAALFRLAEELPAQFVRCHKSFVVNMDFIAELKPTCALLFSGEEVPVSQQRRKPVREAFMAYLGRAL